MDMSDQFEFETKLIGRYGPIVGGPDLLKCLGFRSQAAFKRAQRLGLLGINVFEIESRKGMFALTEDVAGWLMKVSEKGGVICESRLIK